MKILVSLGGSKGSLSIGIAIGKGHLYENHIVICMVLLSFFPF